jgi:solute carrier family 25 phosphate transporter 3
VSGPEALHYQVQITTVSALIAAVLGTLASQPGDVILSAVNSNTTGGSMSTLIVQAAKQLGVSGMFRGIQARLVHVASIVVIQLLVYDYVKQLCGIPATGFH